MTSNTLSPTNPVNSADTRYIALQQFVATHVQAYALNPDSVTVASADASFRRYFRIASTANAATYIIMDAPPEHENCQPFIAVAKQFAAANLNLPTVLEHDLTHGFLLLKDLGNTTYLNALQAGGDHRLLYADAIDALVKLQAASLDKLPALPLYDADKLQQEMALFDTWFLKQHHGITLNERETALLNIALHLITQACTAQAKVWVHRDFHCRNLMHTAQNNPGILDFQDALSGAYTYDLVSLLRDAYIDWPEEAQLELALQYWQKARAAGVPVPEDFGQLWRDFEWMGLQRHLKVLGIFARLSHRDGKHGYLNDLPLVLKYAQSVAQRYDGLGILVRLFDRVQGIERQVGVTF
jgi:N-acetylmuramate 1-kinase